MVRESSYCRVVDYLTLFSFHRCKSVMMCAAGKMDRSAHQMMTVVETVILMIR